METRITHEQIAELAESYWEAEGRPEGRHLEHWLRAEAVLAAALAGGGDGGAGAQEE